jgi:hypothetical protein
MLDLEFLGRVATTHDISQSRIEQPVIAALFGLIQTDLAFLPFLEGVAGHH